MSDNCIFCKIIRSEVKSEVVYEDENVFAMNDAYPKAPIHILVMPKKHIENISNATEKEDGDLGTLLPTVRKIAAELKLDGFKLAVNNGATYGQSVMHLHIHLLSGQIPSGALKSL